ncbi:ATP-grasp domain-containing protein [Geodermatophilus sp. CPCC 205506]|uniref:ATP-grasp domain-containing protein n=1 Tax=Geodermatophilus sp. CPCC 205506 TaxID=2936596 RepID=UPI003EEF883C
MESNLAGSGFAGLRIAKELGCRVTFFTSGTDRYFAVPGGRQHFEAYVDRIELCQTNEIAPLLDRVRAVHAVQPLSGLLSMAEYEVVVAAMAAAELGLPGPDVDSVRAARNKVEMRRRCAQRGVPMPAFRSVTDAAAAVQAAHEVGLPCVVKPADETSSADVRRCTTVEEVVEQFETIRATVFNVRGQRRHREVLVEECALGYEVSVEVLAGRRPQVLGVTDKSVGGTNRFVEVGHLFPSLLPAPIRAACEDVALDAVAALGFDLGLAHVEIKYTADGPRLIEVNPRPPGDRITDLIDLSLGTSCLELVVRQYLGERVDGGAATSPVRGAAIRFLTAEPGRVVGVTGTDVAGAMPGVREAVVSVAPGDLVPPLHRNEDRAGHVLAVGENAYVAARRAEAALGEIAVRTVAARHPQGGGDPRHDVLGAPLCTAAHPAP